MGAGNDVRNHVGMVPRQRRLSHYPWLYQMNQPSKIFAGIGISAPSACTTRRRCGSLERAVRGMAEVSPSMPEAFEEQLSRFFNRPANPRP